MQLNRSLNATINKNEEANQAYDTFSMMLSVSGENVTHSHFYSLLHTNKESRSCVKHEFRLIDEVSVRRCIVPEEDIYCFLERIFMNCKKSYI